MRWWLRYRWCEHGSLGVKHKCGYLEDLVELSESAHRSFIPGILQIRDVAVPFVHVTRPFDSRTLLVRTFRGLGNQDVRGFTTLSRTLRVVPVVL